MPKPLLLALQQQQQQQQQGCCCCIPFAVVYTSSLRRTIRTAYETLRAALGPSAAAADTAAAAADTAAAAAAANSWRDWVAAFFAKVDQKLEEGGPALFAEVYDFTL